MIAFFPGSFDPPTLGHLDLIRRTTPLVQTLIVGIGFNPEKQRRLDPETVAKILRADVAEFPNVQVSTYSGTTWQAAKAVGASVLIRGIRTGIDLEHERGLAVVHRSMGLETMLLPTSPELIHVSSSLVRMLLDSKMDVSPFVSARTAQFLQAGR
jgi:pantetheine-phosphate adenylyltransferase